MKIKSTMKRKRNNFQFITTNNTVQLTLSLLLLPLWMPQTSAMILRFIAE